MSGYQNTYYKTRTQYYTAVDTTTGAPVIFNKPVQFVMLKADGDFYILGNDQDTTAGAAAAPFSWLDGWHPFPVGDPEGQSRTLFTVKAVAGTINVSVIGYY